MLCLSKLLRQEFIAWMMDGAERASTASRGAGSLPVLSVQGTGKKSRNKIRGGLEHMVSDQKLLLKDQSFDTVCVHQSQTIQ